MDRRQEKSAGEGEGVGGHSRRVAAGTRGIPAMEPRRRVWKGIHHDGAGLRMMNIVLSGTNGEAEAHFKVPGHRVVNADDLLCYSLEITGAAGYWVELSRPLIRGRLSQRTERMASVYYEAIEAARLKMREGEPASNVHAAAAQIFEKSGFELGHLSGHSIGLTMIEYPTIGAKSDVELRENMIFSFHPQVVYHNEEDCLYKQDMSRVGMTDGTHYKASLDTVNA